MTSYFRCLSLGTTKLNFTKMSCTMPGGCQGSPWGARGKKRDCRAVCRMLAPAGAATPKYLSLHQCSDTPGHLGPTSQWKPPTSAHIRGQLVPLDTQLEGSRWCHSLLPKSPAVKAPISGCQRLEVAPGSSPGSLRPWPWPPPSPTRCPQQQAWGGGRSLLWESWARGHWGSRSRSMAVGQQVEWERRPKTWNRRSPSACPALPIAPQTNVIKHWEQTGWTSA